MSGIVLAVIRLPVVASAGESLSENKHLLGAQCSAGRIVGGGRRSTFFPLPVNLRSGVAASFPLLSRCANCPPVYSAPFKILESERKWDFF